MPTFLNLIQLYSQRMNCKISCVFISLTMLNYFDKVLRNFTTNSHQCSLSNTGTEMQQMIITYQFKWGAGETKRSFVGF